MDPSLDLSDPMGQARENFRRLMMLEKPEDVTDFYHKWSQNDAYDLQLKPGFIAPSACVEALIRHLGEGKTDVSILDVAAGTGLVGEELRKHGFTNIDVVDASSGMIEKAKEKGVYNTIFHRYFKESNMEWLESDKYDVIVSSAAFGPGHLGPPILPEFVRIVKTGGIVSLSITKDRLVDDKDNNRMAIVDQLEESGQWKRLENIPLPTYYYGRGGETFVFRITK